MKQLTITEVSNGWIATAHYVEERGVYDCRATSVYQTVAQLAEALPVLLADVKIQTPACVLTTER